MILPYTTLGTSQSESNIEVLTINKTQLDQVHQILEDISKKTIVDLSTFDDTYREADINGLDENQLPTGKKPINLKTVRQDKYKKLQENKFTQEFDNEFGTSSLIKNQKLNKRII